MRISTSLLEYVYAFKPHFISDGLLPRILSSWDAAILPPRPTSYIKSRSSEVELIYVIDELTSSRHGAERWARWGMDM